MGNILTYSESLPSIKSYNPLITWHIWVCVTLWSHDTREFAWQFEKFIFPILKDYEWRFSTQALKSHWLLADIVLSIKITTIWNLVGFTDDEILGREDSVQNNVWFNSLLLFCSYLINSFRDSNIGKFLKTHATSIERDFSK